MAIYETFEYAFCYNEEKEEERKRLAVARSLQSDRRAQDGNVSGGGVNATESTRLLDAEEIPMETFTVVDGGSTSLPQIMDAGDNPAFEQGGNIRQGSCFEETDFICDVPRMSAEENGKSKDLFAWCGADTMLLVDVHEDRASGETAVPWSRPTFNFIVLDSADVIVFNDRNLPLFINIMGYFYYLTINVYVCDKFFN